MGAATRCSRWPRSGPVRCGQRGGGGICRLRQVGRVEEIVAIIAISPVVNLLALNAAIRAARAGEQAGASAWCDEVREQCTGGAALNISEIIARIGDSIDRLDRSLEQTQTGTADGVARANEAAAVLNHIATTSHQTLEAVQGIASRADNDMQSAARVLEASSTVARLADELDDKVHGCNSGLRTLMLGLVEVKGLANQLKPVAKSALLSRSDRSPGITSWC